MKAMRFRDKEQTIKMVREFSAPIWNSGSPQKAGWVPFSETPDLSKEKAEAKESYHSTAIALQEELKKKDEELTTAKNRIVELENSVSDPSGEIESLKKQIETLQEENKVLSANQKGTPGRKKNIE